VNASLEAGEEVPDPYELLGRFARGEAQRSNLMQAIKAAVRKAMEKKAR